MNSNDKRHEADQDDASATPKTELPEDGNPEGDAEPSAHADLEDTPEDDGRDAIEDAELVEDVTAEGVTNEAASAADEPETTDWSETRDDAAEPESELAATEAAPEMAQPGPDLTSEPEPYATSRSDPPPPPPPAAPQKSGGGFWASLFGGVIAAGVGFGAAQYMGVDMLGGGDEGPDPLEQALSAQQDRLGELDERLGGLEGQLGQIADAVSTPQTGPIEDRLSGLSDQLEGQFNSIADRFGEVADRLEGLGQSLSGVQDQLTAVDSQLTAVDERLTAVEKRPLTESSETARQAFEAYERELEQLRGNLEQQRTENAQMAEQMAAAAEESQQKLAEATEAAQAQMAQVQTSASTLQEQAQAAAREAALQAAVAQLDGALERGTPYAAALSRLADAAEIPEPLTANAETGVASMADLRASFPEAAREALDASIRQTVSADPTDRVMSFLRSQTGARSLAPKDGDDPDAILSRAEASLRAGDLSAAIAELGMLPVAGQEIMADWISQAQTRVAVTAAADELATAVQGE